jgi:hypothetical protein
MSSALGLKMLRKLRPMGRPISTRRRRRHGGPVPGVLVHGVAGRAEDLVGYVQIVPVGDQDARKEVAVQVHEALHRQARAVSMSTRPGS